MLLRGPIQISAQHIFEVLLVVTKPEKAARRAEGRRGSEVAAVLLPFVCQQSQFV